MDSLSVTQIVERLRITGLDESLAGMAITMAIGLRLCCAAWKWFDRGHVLIAAGVMGLLCAGLMLSMDKGKPWQMLIIQGVTLGVVMGALEFALRAGAAKNIPIVRWLPKDNDYVKEAAPPAA